MGFYTLSFSQSDAIERFFKDYQSNDEFSTTYVSPKMFKMISKATTDKENEELQTILKDLTSLRIISTKKNAEKIYQEANTRLNIKEYEELISVKEKGSNVRFITKENNGKISELLLLIGNKEEFIMMSFMGNIDLNKISKLSQKLNIKGSEHLDKVKK